MIQQFIQQIQSPIGNLTLVSNGTHLTNVLWPDELSPQRPPLSPQRRLGSMDSSLRWNDNDRTNHLAARQLDEYFNGKRRVFDLPIYFNGTPFQNNVWQGLQKIPYGETRSYQQLAALVDRPRAHRAVGNANGRNPLPIIIPCHRVIATGGGLGGFGGGLGTKSFLLDLEISNL